MKTALVHSLTATFEAHARQTETRVEFWLARDLQTLLGYDEWRNFTAVIAKAKIACETSGHPIGDHFVDVNKMVDLGSGSQRDESVIGSKRCGLDSALLPGNIGKRTQAYRGAFSSLGSCGTDEAVHGERKPCLTKRRYGPFSATWQTVTAAAFLPGWRRTSAGP